MYIFKTILLTATILSPVLAHAEDTDDAIIVTANRDETPVSQVGQSVTIITADDIQTRQSVAVVDLLRTVPGVTFSRNGGIGSTASVFIRGAESYQTVALIDGVKLNDPSSPQGGFDFGNLLVGNIERIEVVRGSQSVVWGSQAVGGVINMITQTPTENPSATARIEYGSRDTVHLVGNVAGAFGPVAASVGAGYFKSDGYSAFNQDRGGNERDGYENFGANAKVKVTVSDAISVDLRARYSDGKTDIDGFPAPLYAFADTPEKNFITEFVGYAGLNASFFDGRLRNRIAYAHTQIDRENFDPISTPQITFDAKGTNKRFEYQGHFDVTESTALTFGAETEKSRSVTSSYGGPAAKAEARISGYYGQLSTSPLTGLTVTGGVRLDQHSTYGSKTTLAVNAVYSPNEGQTTLRTSYGEGFRAPSLFELFSDYGNQALVPETSKSWDVGITQKLLTERFEVGAIWFNRNSQNLINFISCFGNTSNLCVGRPYGTYDNVRRSKASGLEFTVRFTPVDALQFSANYTYSKSINRDTRRTLVQRPQHSVNASIDYDWSFGLKTGASITHSGNSFINASNTRRLEGYTLVDLRASYPITSGLEIFVRSNNVFNEKYETIFEYGTPRRAFYTGIRLSL
ncbi:MAG: TonB-dependent receptor [Chakrabartia sp.]